MWVEQRVLFVAAMLLMRNMLALKRTGAAAHASTQKDLELVRKSIEMLGALRYEYVCLRHAG